jgi:putative transposase
MIENKPNIHHRRSIRLKGYDYSQRGYYFVTIFTQNRIRLFGKVKNDEIRLNDASGMILHWYSELESKFPQIRCDAFICMPNHVHFIVNSVSNARPDESREIGQTHRLGQTHRSAPTNTTVGEVVQWFKTMTTNEYIRGVKQNAWAPFAGKLWQRNYWERIVRNHDELQKIRDCIVNNPRNWSNDALNDRFG